MALYSNNSTMGPEGLRPMLLFFGELPRSARTLPSPNQPTRQQYMEDAKEAVKKEQDRERISFAFKKHRGQNGK